MRDIVEPELMRDKLAGVILLMEKLGILSIDEDYHHLNDLMFKFLQGVFWNAHEKRVHREEREARNMGHDEERILNLRLHANERAAKRLHKSMRRIHGYPIERF